MCNNRYEIACYYWSNWHRSPENDRLIEKNWTEWEYLKAAIPRFVGHKQPKKPLWGYLDDSLPETVTLQIDAAADHSITSFLFDWNWIKDDGEGGHGNFALERGFLNTPNRNRLKFAIMWCEDGKIDSIEDAFDYIIERFFSQPNYLRVDGGLYLSLYNLPAFIQILGSIEAVAAAFGRLRQKTWDAGLGEINLNIIEWSLQDDKQTVIGNPANVIERIGFNSVGSYTWAHNTVPKDGLFGSYRDWAKDAGRIMTELSTKFGLPYYPNVSMGWDPSPRCPANQFYRIGGPLMYPRKDGTYETILEPYLSTIVHQSCPEEFRRALIAARKHVDADQMLKTKMISLYAWNEWTEGGYLEPEEEYGMGYLEAIQDVFGEASKW